MPHTVLVFDSETEQEELEMAQNGSKYKYAIDELDEYLRRLKKYQSKNTVKIDDVREKIHELIYANLF